jgi:DNA polymerase-3 subunit beta
VKFRCERDVLVDALGTASRATGGKGTGPVVLSGIHLQLSGNDLHLTGNDRDLTIETNVVTSGLSDGVAVIPARLAVDIVRALEPGAVTVGLAEDEMTP